MASLIKKKIGKHSYWYARECAWVEGRPKIVWQKYLGKADAIVEAMADKPKAPSPQKVVITEFGAPPRFMLILYGLRPPLLCNRDNS